MRRALILTALTAFALLVHGYHPYGEDGGLYIAGIKKLLDPTLYPHWTEFVTEHLRFSLFAPFVAGAVRLTHLGLEPVLLLLYLAGIWTMLHAGWLLLERTGVNELACWGGVALLACWLDLPIAGTSQMLMDPYVTARTFSTPLTLYASAWALEIATRQTHDSQLTTQDSQLEHVKLSPTLCTVCALVIAALFHPLMAGYAVAVVSLILCCGKGSPAIRRHGPWALLAVAIVIATTLQLRAPAESPNYVWVAMTRYYWFPFRWEWYEQLGLIAPLLLLACLYRTNTAGLPRKTLIRSTLSLAVIALVIAVLFCRAHLPTHLVARMQPLRTYGFVYEVMILLLGAWLAERVLARHVWRWALLFVIFGSLFFYVQRSTYPASAHLELPGRAPRNPYVRAFLWARANTPKDALFALDAHYITRDGEDAQPFRAIAERSALADYSKDGGEASITPPLTERWVQGQAAQTDLDRLTDAERTSRLQPLSVGWIVLRSSSATNWACLYRDTTVKVCKVPWP